MTIKHMQSPLPPPSPEEWKFQGGGGVQKQKFLKTVWSLIGISGGVGVQTKNLPWGGEGRRRGEG